MYLQLKEDESFLMQGDLPKLQIWPGSWVKINSNKCFRDQNTIASKLLGLYLLWATIKKIYNPLKKVV